MVARSALHDEQGPVHPHVLDAGLIERQTRFLRAVDHRLGGGHCLDDALTLIYRTRHLPVLPAGNGQERLDIAMADLHDLAAWASFDIGLVPQADRYFTRALALAGRGGDDRLVADIFRRIGVMRMHEGDPGEALGYFQFGLQTAGGAGAGQPTGILLVHQAWAHAAMGAADEACELMANGRNRFASAGEPGSFTQNDMLAATGTVHSELAHRVDPEHARSAIAALTEATGGYGNDRARSRTFSQITLAMCHLVDGDVDHGVDIGLRALASAENLASVRVRDCLRPLGADAERLGTHPGAWELATRISAFVGTTGGRP